MEPTISHSDQDQIEQKNRTDLVLGVLLAAVVGFVLNILSTIYYSLFIVKTVTWDKMDHFQIYCIGLLLVGLIGFLEFFIYDYKNDIQVNRSLIRRYLTYFFYNFRPGRVIRVIAGLYLTFILGGVIVSVYFFLAHSIGSVLAAAVVIVVLVGITLKVKSSLAKDTEAVSTINQ
jgi:preprotein translocase subunit Sss1